MKNKVWKSLSINDLPKIANEFIQSFSEYKVVVFVGKMGAGKTTFIKELCKSYEIEDDASSPTFSLVNEYLSKQNIKFYHFDFYRIEKEEEAFDMGFEEYLDSGSTCFIEWPDRVEGLLPERFLLVTIKEENQVRTIEAKAI